MFFFPFSDDNPTQNTPYVTYFLIGVCCFIFLWQFTLPPQLFESAVYNFGVVPASLLGSKEGCGVQGKKAPPICKRLNFWEFHILSEVSNT